MESHDRPEVLETHFAPPERLSDEEMLGLNRTYASFDTANRLIDSIPDLVMVLSHTRQVVAVNKSLVSALGVERPEELIGMRPGEVVDCVHSHEMPAGCGTSVSCASCDAVQAILDCIDKRQATARECRIITFEDSGEGLLDLYVEAIPITVDSLTLYVITMRDNKQARAVDPPGFIPRRTDDQSPGVWGIEMLVESLFGQRAVVGEPIRMHLRIAVAP